MSQQDSLAQIESIKEKERIILGNPANSAEANQRTVREMLLEQLQRQLRRLSDFPVMDSSEAEVVRAYLRQRLSEKNLDEVEPSRQASTEEKRAIPSRRDHNAEVQMMPEDNMSAWLNNAKTKLPQGAPYDNFRVALRVILNDEHPVGMSGKTGLTAFWDHVGLELDKSGSTIRRSACDHKWFSSRDTLESLKKRMLIVAGHKPEDTKVS